MRALLIVAMVTLAGCTPNLTEEQKRGLEVIAALQPDPDHARFKVALNTVSAREQVYVDAANDWQRGTDEYREADNQCHEFLHATNHLVMEYFRRQKIDGKKAADWYIKEARKSDSQIVSDWLPERSPLN